jgi:endonuclease/exonuclease/phosphatase family metal-dependent hydrolase
VSFVETIVTDEYDQPRDLLGPDYHLAHQVARGANGAGITLASRWPIGEVHELDLHVTPTVGLEFPAATLAAEIDVPDAVGQLLFVSTNPSWQLPLEPERQAQAVASAQFIEHLAGDRHVVLAGDFERHAGRHKHAVLARPARFGRAKRLLPRRMGDRASRRTRPYLHPKEPASR